MKSVLNAVIVAACVHAVTCVVPALAAENVSKNEQITKIAKITLVAMRVRGL